LEPNFTIIHGKCSDHREADHPWHHDRNSKHKNLFMEGNMYHNIRSRLVIIIALALILGASSYAFAAANTVPVTGAGDGSGTISGYAAGSIHYNLNTGNPSSIDSVSFTLTPIDPSAGTPASVKAQIGTTWADSCTLSSGTWTCSFTGGVSVLNANSLRIVAAQ
jgi:hypothetical protein